MSLINQDLLTNKIWEFNDSVDLLSEPNSYEKKAAISVNGSQLGEDFLHLREILRKSKMYSSSGLYGPDIGQPRGHRKDLLSGWDTSSSLRANLFM